MSAGFAFQSKKICVNSHDKIKKKSGPFPLLFIEEKTLEYFLKSFHLTWLHPVSLCQYSRNQGFLLFVPGLNLEALTCYSSIVFKMF